MNNNDKFEELLLKFSILSWMKADACTVMERSKGRYSLFYHSQNEYEHGIITPTEGSRLAIVYDWSFNKDYKTFLVHLYTVVSSETAFFETEKHICEHLEIAPLEIKQCIFDIDKEEYKFVTPEEFLDTIHPPSNIFDRFIRWLSKKKRKNV
jgi:hypothetical protein